MVFGQNVSKMPARKGELDDKSRCPKDLLVVEILGNCWKRYYAFSLDSLGLFWYNVGSDWRKLNLMMLEITVENYESTTQFWYRMESMIICFIRLCQVRKWGVSAWTLRCPGVEWRMVVVDNWKPGVWPDCQQSSRPIYFDFHNLLWRSIVKGTTKLLLLLQWMFDSLCGTDGRGKDPMCCNKGGGRGRAVKREVGVCGDGRVWPLLWNELTLHNDVW